MNVFRGHPSRSASGFTLVELLVVIAIIGILAGIAVPAVFRAVSTAKSTKMRLEVGAIEQAVERYQEKYGDYPPDFSDWAVVERHYRKIFPRIASTELTLLRDATDISPGDGNLQTHNPTTMDRAEVLTWVLGGYSSNPLTPFTGAGGPLEFFTDENGDGHYQINTSRENALYEFDTTRTDLVTIDDSKPLSGTNRFRSSDDDLFLSYEASDEGAPFVYFDSRSYGYYDVNLADFNGFGSTDFGVIRPYLSDIAVPNKTGIRTPYPDAITALAAWQFMNPDTFQIIAPGVDSNFGFSTVAPGVNLPLYFQYATGKGIAPKSGNNYAEPGDLLITEINRYQESSAFPVVDDFQQDNLTNFSKAKLIDELQE